jgi:hypothetical protein
MTKLINFLGQKAGTPKFASNMLLKVQRPEENQFFA